MSAQWFATQLQVPATGCAYPLAIPSMTQEDAEAAVGYSVAMFCPLGCHHVIAAETGWDTMLELATARLEPAPGADGFLVAAFYPPSHAAAFKAVKASSDAVFLGRVN